VAIQVHEHGKEILQRPDQLLKDNPTFLFLLSTGAVLTTILGITGLVLRSKFRKALALRLPTLTHAVIICFLAPPMYLLVLQVAVWVMPRLPDFGFLKELSEQVKAVPPWLVLIGGAIFPGIGEEIFCRGFLGRGLVARWGIVLGTLFTAFIFGLIHIEPVMIVYATFIGIVLQLIYLMSKSLLSTMLLHALNNTIALLPSALAEDVVALNIVDQWEQNNGLPPFVLATSIAAVLTLLLLFYQTRVRWFRGDGQPWDPGYVTAEMPPARVNPIARADWPAWWGVLLALLAYAAWVVVMLGEFGVVRKFV
jgi:membrane protease YdiL (CAAX protease family)